MICRRGHEFRGDENTRARKGWCPVCHRETQARYDRSEKGRARHQTYNDSEKGHDRKTRYQQSPQGWKSRMADRRRLALGRRKQRMEAEDSNGSL